jgi:hypothetical protein
MRTLVSVAAALVVVAGCGDVAPVASSSSLTSDRALPQKRECGDPDGSSGNVKKCKKGLTCCSGACVDTSTDDANCGGCGQLCVVPVGGSGGCAGGVCSASCPNGDDVCAGVCTPINPAENVAGATPVAPPQTVAGDIAAAGATQTFSFVGPSMNPIFGDTRITSTETPTSGLVAIVTVYDGVGHIVATTCGAGTNSVGVTFVPGEQYFAVVAGVGSSTGSYAFSVAFTP